MSYLTLGQCPHTAKCVRVQLCQGGGAAWKTGCFREAPRWVQAVMANNFKTLVGAFAVLGLMGLPLHLFAARCAWHQLGATLSMPYDVRAITAYDSGVTREDLTVRIVVCSHCTVSLGVAWVQVAAGLPVGDAHAPRSSHRWQAAVRWRRAVGPAAARPGTAARRRQVVTTVFYGSSASCCVSMLTRN